MNIRPEQKATIKDAENDFNSVATLADKEGSVYIFDNGELKYRLVSIKDDIQMELTESEKIEVTAKRVLFRPSAPQRMAGLT